ncbi:MAG: hypothetical protein KKA73_20940 [Chloroflexi bacterium]|nr:hypothetical protein [Chloroflexota bacterium]MBU1750159.1 hypothetical protein [Chloroflexota bacterium]MBU1879082.1 hypothetical protein [Chloroflexota bacterium]
MRISVVGVCASGKTVLAQGLQRHGYDARSCAQEHSYVPDMWQRIARPDVLIYLDAGLATIRRRRPNTTYTVRDLDTAHHRLRHARQHAHLIIATDARTEAAVLAEALRFLREHAGPGSSTQKETR